LPGEKLAQSCHAAFTFAHEHGDITDLWINESNYICILETNEKELLELLDLAMLNDIRFSIFREPDMGDMITAVALSPGPKSKKLCSGFRLGLN
jgi:hypothetical protein